MPTNNSAPRRQERTVPTDLDADADLVSKLVEENRRLRDEVADLREQLDDHDDRLDDHDDQLDDQEARLDDQDDRLDEHDDQLDDQDARIDALSTGLSTAHQDIEAVEADIEAAEPTVSDDETALQRDEMTPIERLSTDGDVEEVTTSASVERAVTIFDNIQSWGTKVPKGYTIRPDDNPLALLEAARDESLSWRQWYRAAETLEQLSRGAVTFFDSDRHGKTLVLHDQSEVYERVTSGALSSSSAGATP